MLCYCYIPCCLKHWGIFKIDTSKSRTALFYRCFKVMLGSSLRFSRNPLSMSLLNISISGIKIVPISVFLFFFSWFILLDDLLLMFMLPFYLCDYSRINGLKSMFSSMKVLIRGQYCVCELLGWGAVRGWRQEVKSICYNMNYLKNIRSLKANKQIPSRVCDD